jgi:hypothetical protein
MDKVKKREEKRRSFSRSVMLLAAFTGRKGERDQSGIWEQKHEKNGTEAGKENGIRNEAETESSQTHGGSGG